MSLRGICPYLPESANICSGNQRHDSVSGADQSRAEQKVPQTKPDKDRSWQTHDLEGGKISDESCHGMSLQICSDIARRGQSHFSLGFMTRAKIVCGWVGAGDNSGSYQTTVPYEARDRV